jgi:hypothetical protein
VVPWAALAKVEPISHSGVPFPRVLEGGGGRWKEVCGGGPFASNPGVIGTSLWWGLRLWSCIIQVWHRLLVLHDESVEHTGRRKGATVRGLGHGSLAKATKVGGGGSGQRRSFYRPLPWCGHKEGAGGFQTRAQSMELMVS